MMLKKLSLLFVSLVLVLSGCNSLTKEGIEEDRTAPQSSLGAFGVTINEGSLEPEATLSPQAELDSSDLNFAIDYSSINFVESLDQGTPGQGILRITFLFSNKQPFAFENFSVQLDSERSRAVSSIRFASSQGPTVFTSANATSIPDSDLPDQGQLGKRDQGSTYRLALEVTYTENVIGIFINLFAETVPELVLSNSTVLEETNSDSIIGRLSAQFSDKPAVFKLISGEGDSDNTAFRIEDSVLKSAIPLSKDRYQIRIAWQASDGQSKTQNLEISQVSSDTIIAGERVGDFGFIGQAGSDQREREPTLIQDWGNISSYYFQENNSTTHQVDLCKSTDSVISVKVNKEHPKSAQLETTEQVGFTTSFASLKAILGEPDASVSAFGYSTNSYHSNEIPQKFTNYDYLLNNLEEIQAISVSYRHCPELTN